MSYSRNFGFRSFENIVRNARFRVPATGTPIKIGAPVSIDGSNPGRLVAATEALAPGTGKGVVLYEHILKTGVDTSVAVPEDFDFVPLDAYAQVVSGPGVKVWFKSGLLNAGVDIADDIDPGVGLVPDGAGKYRVTDLLEDEVSWFIVEQSNASTGVVEARITF
jgi:hypothetical protein